MAERHDLTSIESSYSWRRLGAAAAIGTVGGVGMWSVVVILPAIQAEFGAARGDASMPYAASMVGFAIGGVLMGRLVDRLGIVRPLLAGVVALGIGHLLAAQASSLWQFALAHALFVSMVGGGVMFGPLIADTSQWFDRNRGIAVALCASGNYAAGAVWPPLIYYAVEQFGWRLSLIGLGVICVVIVLPLASVLRRRLDTMATTTTVPMPLGDLGLARSRLLLLLCLAGVGCCVAMSMPQVHIVAYCGDLGYGVARGAEMLSVMLGFGVTSRIISGLVTDRIGGLTTLLIGSLLQMSALVLYFFFDGLTSLYVISALFGLFQGGIVSTYAVVVREYFPPADAATKLGLILMATLFGMAVGGWLSGLIFDWTESYRAAFLNGIGWNMINVLIVAWLLWRVRAPGSRRLLAA